MKTTDKIQSTFYEATLGEDSVVALERKPNEPWMPNVSVNVSSIYDSSLHILTFFEVEGANALQDLFIATVVFDKYFTEIEHFSAINLNYQPIPMGEEAILEYLELFIAVKEEK